MAAPQLQWVQETLRNATTRPHVIMLELHAARMDKLGYAGGALGLVEQLYSLGYTDVYHAGYALRTLHNGLTSHVSSKQRCHPGWVGAGHAAQEPQPSGAQQGEALRAC